MNTDLLIRSIRKHITLSNEEERHIKTLFQERHLPKNTFVLSQNEPCHYIYFVNSGILRAFHLNSRGKESTIMFALSDWWISDMYCFLQERPTMVNIQVVEQCCLLQLSKENLDQLYKDIPQFNTFFRILMQNAYCREQLRMIQNLSLPAKERYEQFIQKYPHIAEKVKLKQIASYLGITPEFLSSVRSKKG